VLNSAIAASFSLQHSGGTPALVGMSDRDFDPEDYGWDWDSPPSEIVRQNRYGTFTNLFNANGNVVSNLVVVFVDGACRNNGTSYAQGGVGIYFGRNSGFNWAGHLTRGRAHSTSQRAELAAALRAIHQCEAVNDRYPSITHFVIASDSQYLVRGITDWIYKWVNNGWTNSAGDNLANADLWSELHSRVCNTWLDIMFWKVDRDENEEADEMAKNASWNN
jgi:ribonuclease HI